MPKHIILTDVELNLDDVIVVPRSSLPQIIDQLEPGEYTLRNTSPPRTGTVREVVVDPPDPPEGVAPSVTLDPSWASNSAQVDQRVTFNRGAASGTPQPTATVSVFRGAVDVTYLVSNSGITFPQAGQYTVRVTWSNGIGSPVTVTSAAINVVVPPAWQIAGGMNGMVIETMPTPVNLPVAGGLNEITVGT